MEDFTDRRVWEDSLLKFFHRISVLHGNSGKYNQLGSRIAQHVATYYPVIIIQYQLAKPVSLLVLGYETAGIGHRQFLHMIADTRMLSVLPQFYPRRPLRD